MRILEVASHSSVRRGGAIQLLRLARELRRRGHDVHCVFNRPEGKQVRDSLEDLRYFEQEVCPVTTLPLTGAASFAARMAFRRLVRQGGFEVIHAHRDEALLFAWTSAFFARRFPPIVAQRGNSYPLKRLRPIRAAFRSPRVARVVAVADAVRDVLVQCGIPASKIDVVYGGVDLERFHPGIDGASLRRELGIRDDSVVFGNVASIGPRKGHAEFFQAAARVRARRPNAVFLLAGDGNFRKYRPLLDSLGLTDSVVYAGFRRDVERVFAAADVVVCSPNKGEGLSGVIREALAMEKPVVSTDVAGNREFVRDGETGRLVPPVDPDSLARAMLDLAGDPQRARQYARRGREAILDLIDNRRRCDRIERIYHSVAGDSH